MFTIERKGNRYRASTPSGKQIGWGDSHKEAYEALQIAIIVSLGKEKKREAT